MTAAFVSKQFAARFGDRLREEAKGTGHTLEFMTVPEGGAQLPQEACDRIDCTFMDRDIRFDEELYATYGEALMASTSCKWLHSTSSGITSTPFLAALQERGATLTSSTGSNAEPVAQTGFTGLLMLARGFASYVRGQHKREWTPLRGAALPDDLRGQTVLLLGVGAIGKKFAGYARAFGLKVIGVRRSPRTPDDPVDELHPPSELSELLPRANWIVITCPLTSETRNLLDRQAFERMRKGVRLINIARGEIVDDDALIAALRSGKLAGAHLDAHTQEPLPADSPLWDLPNVIISPHNASASTGNEKRAAEMFIANVGRWLRGEPLLNVQRV